MWIRGRRPSSGREKTTRKGLWTGSESESWTPMLPQTLLHRPPWASPFFWSAHPMTSGLPKQTHKSLVGLKVVSSKVTCSGARLCSQCPLSAGALRILVTVKQWDGLEGGWAVWLELICLADRFLLSLSRGDGHAVLHRPPR